MASGNLREFLHQVSLLDNNTVMSVTHISDDECERVTYHYDVYDAVVEADALRNLANLIDDNVKKMRKQTNE